MEIERKFLIKDTSTLDLSKYKKIEISQDYLYKDKFTVIRKRRCVKEGKVFYKYTIKTDRQGISINEIEKDISQEEYYNLKINPNYYTLSKDRYIIPYTDGLKIELDLFKGKYEGIIFAEIEFESEDQAYNIELPNWFTKELSEKVTNSDMALKNLSISYFDSL